MLYYELTDEFIVNAQGNKLYRIRATKELPNKNVKKGDMGGYVESTLNLGENARVYGHAEVFGHAQVRSKARVKTRQDIISTAYPDFYNITVTPQYIFIGCKDFRRDKRITKQEAIKLGMPAHIWSGLTTMLKGACRLVKRDKGFKYE